MPTITDLCGLRGVAGRGLCAKDATRGSRWPVGGREGD